MAVLFAELLRAADEAILDFPLLCLQILSAFLYLETDYFSPLPILYSDPSHRKLGPGLLQ